MKTIILFCIFLIPSLYALEPLDVRELNVVLQEIKRFEAKNQSLTKNQNLNKREKKKERKRIQAKILSFNKNLINIISADQVFEEGHSDKMKIDLWGQLEEVLKPVLSSLRKISKRPRKIEKLKDSIEVSEGRLAKIENSLAKLAPEQVETAYPELIGYTEGLRSLLTGEKNKILLKNLKFERELQLLEKNQEPWLSQARKILSGFFLAKAWHLLVALVSFVVFIALSLSIKKLFSGKMRLGSWQKAFSYTYTGLCLIFASCSSLLVLYFFNDWFLVTIFLLFISGFVWSLRNVLPLFIQEFKLVMNIGPIREGERIVWKGLPYKVTKLAIRSTVENPVIEGGKFKIAAKNILNLTSRPCNENEKWFLTEKGDWLELEKDKAICQVIFQGVEYVELNFLYGGLKTMTTDNFIKMDFKVLSAGYWIDFNLCLGRNHGPEIFETIIPKLKEEITSQMFHKVSEMKDQDFQVDYLGLKDDSHLLNLKLSCPGKFAKEKKQWESQLRQIFFELMKDQNWQLPKREFKIESSHPSH